MSDDKFVVGQRFRLGIPIVPAGCSCMHAQSKDQEKLCGKELDRHCDHAVGCNTGPFIACRHARLNSTLAQAGRDAGYATLMEQVVPEFGLRKRLRNGQVKFEEAVLDIELFGHPTSHDRLLDGTVRHSAASHIVSAAAALAGAAAAEGVLCKERRYPPRAGKSVIPCAAETWGFVDPKLDALLDELAVLAAQKQRDRGLQPSNWKSKWRTLISIGLALDVSKAILAAIPVHFKPCCPAPLTAVEVM
jgi:hypothetical protein